MKCGVCGKSVTGTQTTFCEVCGMAVLPAPLLSEADIRQYQRTCAIAKVEWEQVLRLREEAEKLALDIENMKGVFKRLTQEIVNKEAEIKRLTQEVIGKKTEAGQLAKDAEDKKAADEQLKKEINSKKAAYAGLEQELKQIQQELSTLRQQVKEESKRKPVAPPIPVPPKSIFCGKCGTKRAPEDIFCGKCGNRLE
jgi:DNA repair exonuclease SbcCD ATPase subunit